jgi:hypothetical protein
MLIIEDFDTHMYAEIIEAIERDNEAAPILEKAIKTAEKQAKGYLSRFDIETLFAAEAEERDEMLLTYLKDLAVWHYIVLANPNMDISFFQLRYESAIMELGKIQSGKVVPYGWPPAVDPEYAGTFFHVNSNPRRGTSY